MKAFRYLHQFYGGFTQRVGFSGNGMYEAFDRIYQAWAGPNTLVEYFPWYVDAAAIAREIVQRNRDCLIARKTPLRIHLVGHSFGGQTAANVCHELQQLASQSIPVEQLCLCDAVARCGRLGWIRAANPLVTIDVADNVQSLQAFVQTHPRFRLQRPFFFPAGHGLYWRGADVVPMQIDAEHTEIDSHPTVHKAISGQARALHMGPGPAAPPCVLPFSRRPSPLDVRPDNQRRAA